MALGSLARSLDLFCRKPGASATQIASRLKWTASGGGAGTFRGLSFLLMRVHQTPSQEATSRSWGGQRAREKSHCYSTRQHGHEKSKDLYAILGVTPHATQQQIKEAYYKSSMKYHPDRNRGSPEAHQKFTALTDAYSILGQYELRKKYDKGLLHQYPRQPHSVHRHEPSSAMNMHGRKVRYNFDEYYRAHYGEALQRTWREAREKKAAQEKARLQTLSGTTQRVLIVTVSGLVLLVGWMHRRSRTSIVDT